MSQTQNKYNSCKALDKIFADNWNLQHKMN